MTKISILFFFFLCCFAGKKLYAQAVFNQVTVTSGTQTFGSLTVTVSTTGTPTLTFLCGISPFCTYPVGPVLSGHKFVFSSPVFAIRAHFTSIGPTDTAGIDINASPYTVTNADLSAYTPTVSCSPSSFSNFAYNGYIVDSANPLLFPIVQFDAHPAYLIDSVYIYEESMQSGTSGFGHDFYFAYGCPGTVAATAAQDSLCAGDSLHLYGSGSYLSSSAAYSWAGPNGFSSTSQNALLNNIAALAAGTYTLTATDTGSCVYTASVNIAVTAQPSAPLISYSSPVCTGQSLQLSASNSLSGLNWQWTGPDNFSSSIYNPSVSNVQLIDSGYYVVTASLNNCKATDSVMVHVGPSPAVPIVGSNSPVCAGDSLIFALSNPQAGLAYTWSGPGSYNSALQNPVRLNAQTTYSGTYKVVADLNGCRDSASTSVVVNPSIGPPTISIAVLPKDTICAGGNTSFTALVSNAGSPAYQWNLNGSNVGSNSPTYSSGSLANGAIVLCKVSSVLQCQALDSATSNNIHMYVIPVTPQTLSISQYPINYTTGSLVTFTGLPSPNNNLSYQWTKNGIDIPGANSYIFSSSNVNLGDTICLLIHSSGQCVSPDSLEECVELTSSVSSLQSGLSTITVYPNPISNQLFIEGAAPGTTISIYNIIGQRVYSATINTSSTLERSGEVTINTASFSAGNYILELSATDGSREIKKIVKE